MEWIYARLPRTWWSTFFFRRLPNGFRRATGLTLTGAFGLLIAVALWILGRVLAGRPVFLLAYGTAAIVLLAWLSTRRGLRLRGDRGVGLAYRVHEGEVLDVPLNLSAKRTLSTVIIEEQVPERLGQTVKLPLEEIHSGQTQAHYELRCWRRGAFSVGPLVARFGDPVGLISREQVLAPPFEVLVHPTLGAVKDRPLTRQFEDPPLRPKVSKPWPSGLEFYGMRELRPGDDLRRIVWRVLARTGRLVVREAEQGITDRVCLILNNWEGAYPRGEEYSEGFETAVRVIASLGIHHLKEGFSVRLEACQGSLTPLPLRGELTRVTMLDALARVERGRAALSDVIVRLIRQQQALRDVHTVFVTPRLDRGEAAQLRLVLRTGASVLVVVVRYGDRYEEAAHNAAALGCQVLEATPGGASLAGDLLGDLGEHFVGIPA